MRNRLMMLLALVLLAGCAGQTVTEPDAECCTPPGGGGGADTRP